MFGCCWLCCLCFFLNNITVSWGSLENSEILRYTQAMKHCFQKPGISNAFSGTKYTKGAREALSCSFLLLPSFEHRRSCRQAENKDHLSVCPQRVACAHTREPAQQPDRAAVLHQCQPQQQHLLCHASETSWKFRDWFSGVFTYTETDFHA